MVIGVLEKETAAVAIYSLKGFGRDVGPPVKETCLYNKGRIITYDQTLGYFTMRLPVESMSSIVGQNRISMR